MIKKKISVKRNIYNHINIFNMDVSRIRLLPIGLYPIPAVVFWNALVISRKLSGWQKEAINAECGEVRYESLKCRSTAAVNDHLTNREVRFFTGILQRE